MKNNTSFAICLFIAFIISACAYGQSGIYKTAEDYKNHHLSYECDCKKSKHSIRLHDFLQDKQFITVDKEGTREILKKNEIYGFADCDSNVYRFFNNTKYRIEEPGDIYIYTRNERDVESKIFKLVKVYYFSVAPNSAIIPLSLANLKRTYKTNDKFVDLLDANFNKTDISAYDDFHKTYRVNHVYQQSL